MDELEQVKQDLIQALSDKDAAVTALQAKGEELESVLTELNQLREFKSAIEAEASKQTKLESIKQKFVDSGIEKSESYFSDNQDTLLAMDEAAFEFMLQELVAFSSAQASASDGSEDTSSVKVPRFTNSNGKLTPAELAKALRARKAAGK